ncbi:MAG: PilZ domain-containing protein [Pseudohongiellaceae bacterium]
MNALNLTDGDITLRKDVIQLLKMAISQKWEFSYVTTAKKKVTSRALELVAVTANEGTFSVGRELGIADLDLSEPLMFRAQSGGVSIIFQSRINEAQVHDPIIKSSSLYHFDLPYKIACTQLRKTVRVNLEAISEVPVVLYLVNGALIEGTVIDISTAGAKFKVEKDLGKELHDPQVLDACKISLPNELALQTGAQLIGMVNDAESGTSYLRCQFVHMRTQDEEKLDGFISGMLQQIESFAQGGNA